MKASIRWQDPTYLRTGTPRQQAALNVLQDLKVFEILADYSPVLVGSLPLAIDLPSSDLDIICAADNLAGFSDQVKYAFGNQADFRIKQKVINGLQTTVAKFASAGFAVEIFGQPRPVEAQNAYRHMVVEARLLEIGGEEAQQAIRQLKGKGLKTEPAFARYFNLGGDPYAVLLEMGTLEEDALRAALRLRGANHG